MAVKLIDIAGLREKGITYSESQINRKVKAGTFPKPVMLGERRKAWVVDEIDAWVEGLIKAREQKDAA